MTAVQVFATVAMGLYGAAGVVSLTGLLRYRAQVASRQARRTILVQGCARVVFAALAIVALWTDTPDVAIAAGVVLVGAFLVVKFMARRDATQVPS